MPNFSSQFDINHEATPDVDAIEADLADISHARLKLDDLLNEIVDKNEDCFTTDDENNKNPRVSTITTTVAKRPYTVGKAPRKKKKKDPAIEEIGESQKASYVIKLFDREIDLASFEADASLYGMAREWMKNKPHMMPSQQLETPIIPDINIHHENESQMESEENKEHFIYELPKPVKFEEACYPRPLPPALKTALVEDIIDTEDDIEELRKDNMLRWRKVRNRWKEHSLRQQRRYVDSLITLKTLFATQTS